MTEKNNLKLFVNLHSHNFFTMKRKVREEDFGIKYEAIYDAYGSPVHVPDTYNAYNELIVENAYGRMFMQQGNYENAALYHPKSASLGINAIFELNSESSLGINLHYHLFFNNSFVYNADDYSNWLDQIKAGNEKYRGIDYIFNIEDENYISNYNFVKETKIFPIEFGVSYIYKIE